MRVLAIGHSWVVDVYRSMLRHLAALPDMDLTVVTPDYWEEGGAPVYATHSSQDNFKLLIEKPLSHRQHLHVYPGILGVLKRTHPDIVFLLEEPNSLVTATTLSLARWLKPQPKGVFYTFLNDDRDFRSLPGLRKVLFPLALQTTFRLAHAGVCASPTAEREMRRRGFAGLTAEIPFGVAVRAYADVAPARVAAFRAQLAPQSEFILGFVGRVAPGKGVDLLVKALPEPAMVGARLVVVGDGEDLPAMKDLAQRLGVSDRISFISRVLHSDVRSYMAAFDALAVPSQRHGHWVEQFGRVVVEGMAVGAPVIGSSSGEIPNVIGDAGYVFEEANLRDFCAKVLQLRHLTPAARAALIEHARTMVLERFDYETVARQYARLFQQLMA